MQIMARRVAQDPIGINAIERDGYHGDGVRCRHARNPLSFRREPPMDGDPPKNVYAKSVQMFQGQKPNKIRYLWAGSGRLNCKLHDSMSNFLHSAIVANIDDGQVSFLRAGLWGGEA